ncbi:MAG: 50S ribosomal protein L18 [Holosporaceae bacterium]|jgi:large subunit ribosomal protein L18|nr:50S ribosomal protein L18 [Holosporaceae bacterium]
MSRFGENFCRRATRVRYRVRHNACGRPRLSVFRSGRHIYAQIIDDSCGRTLCSASTLDKAIAESPKRLSRDAVSQVGRIIAERALADGVSKVVFDRGGYSYHGRVKILAEGARGGGLLF